MSTALITGASRGIGKEVARVLAVEGTRVLACVRDLSRAPRFSGAEPEPLDVGDPKSIRALAARLTERAERLDILVNNAGVYRAPAREVWDVNVRGPLLLTRALAPLLSRGARVVMVTSGLGRLQSQDRDVVRRLQDPSLTLDDIARMAEDAPDGYGASKAALNAMARLFARELAPRSILVNAVSPGWAATDMGGTGAPRTVQQGAESVLWGTRLTPDGPTGGSFEDGEPLE
jgi:NAD(P)-dependent dehydrogenase (short-subunit alcohol dehydrogenase family)